MKKLICILCLLSIVTINAQSDKNLETSKKFFMEVKAKPLYVIMDVEDEKFVNKLIKKGKTTELSNYKKLIDNNNTYLRSAVEKYLTHFSNVKYITSKELRDMSEKEIKKVNVLLRTFPMSLGMNPVGSGMVWRESRMESFEMDTTKTETTSLIEFRTSDGDEMTPYYSQHMTKLFYPYSDVCYAMRRLQTYITDCIEKRDTQYATAKYSETQDAMKSKTLVINRNWISKDLNEAAIKTVYPYKIKLVKTDEYEKEICGNSMDVLVLMLIPFTAGPMNMGEVHTIFDPSTSYVFIPHMKKCTGTIEKKHFEYYLKKN